MQLHVHDTNWLSSVCLYKMLNLDRLVYIMLDISYSEFLSQVLP